MNQPFRPITRRVLDAGAGPKSNSRLHPIFAGWTVVRLDINPAVQPDIIGTITDLRARIPNASFDAIWSSHNIEHLHTFEVPAALNEFKRILKPDGFAFMTWWKRAEALERHQVLGLQDLRRNALRWVPEGIARRGDRIHR